MVKLNHIRNHIQHIKQDQIQSKIYKQQLFRILIVLMKIKNN